MKDELVAEVMQQMLPYLDNAQLKQLRLVMEHTLFHCDISDSTAKPEEDDSGVLVASFIAAKRIEGCSEKTLKYYQTTIDAMVTSLDKNVRHILTEDLRGYLTKYQGKHQSSRVTIDNIRRILSSFFSWLEDEDYIIKSPVRRIHKVKTASSIKETYSDEELEKMRDNCEELRDLAMIDMLASTGMRVGEMVLLNRDDINFAERECVVFGKGDKERIVYFDARAKLHLQEYLNSRTDDNPALFVTLRSPYERIRIGGIEHRLREMGKRLNIPKVHPHKFRRTLATMAIDKGMPIEQLQRLLGHRRIDTTLNGMLTNEEVIQELLNLAKQIAAAQKEGAQLGLTADELAFYDALTKPQAIKDFYENEELIAITKELADTLRKNRTIDWQRRDSARAKMRMMIKKLLRKHRYPPEGMDDAVQTVMTQCELWTDNTDMVS